MNALLLTVANIAIAVLGVTAFALSQMNASWARKTAPILGLSAQPFWFITQWSTANYGVLVVCALYTVIWTLSFINQWVVLPRRLRDSPHIVACR